jgi:SNF2 family DNA or RNA helicase
VIVWYGLTWSLELYQQANARLHRQGQTRPVIIHHLIAEGTVDEQVMRALKAKDTGQSALLAALKERSRG